MPSGTPPRDGDLSEACRAAPLNPYLARSLGRAFTPLSVSLPGVLSHPPVASHQRGKTTVGIPTPCGSFDLMLRAADPARKGVSGFLRARRKHKTTTLVQVSRQEVTVYGLGRRPTTDD
jgi:hypothetical protein